MPRAGIALSLLLAGLVGPAPARACTLLEIGVFGQADEAAIVAVGRIANRRMRPIEVLAGPRARSIRVRAGDPRNSCSPLVRKRRSLVFLYPDRTLVGHSTGYIEDPSADLVDALRRYLDAVDDAGRRAILVDYATGQGTLARHAALRLAERIDLLAAATADERARLVAAVPFTDRETLPSLALVLARLHAIEAIAPLAARLDDVPYVEQIAIPLELLANHREPLDDIERERERERESERWREWRIRMDHRALLHQRRDPPPTPVAVVREHWTRWLASHRGWSEGAIRRSGFEERGVTPPGWNDPRSLAAAIRTGPDALTRVVAWDRCEHYWRRRLFSSRFSADGTASHLWHFVATACETGRPHV